ncbi:EamA family transporter [Nocardiopsis composta]
MAQRSGDRMWAVAAAAGLWGTSALMREPLSAVMPAPAIVFYEHLIIALCLTPWVVPAFRELARSGARTIIAMAVVGGGSSALATTLFTLAFTTGDPITPQVLQKLQPLFAILLAVALLGERLRPASRCTRCPPWPGPGCWPSPTRCR